VNRDGQRKVVRASISEDNVHGVNGRYRSIPADSFVGSEMQR
jgi:hypothetical protein